MTARLLSLVLWLLAAAPAAAQHTCSPPALGHPCATGGIAMQGAVDPEPNLGIGNPVHLATGNKHQHEIDLPGHAANPLLQLTRHYNSLDPRHGVFGRGWSHAYDTRLYVVADRIQIVQADGSRIHFGGPSRSGEALVINNRHGRLERQAGRWLWTWPDQRQLRFDESGHLVRIAVPLATGHNFRSATPRVAVLDIVRHYQPGPLQGKIHRIVAANNAATDQQLLFAYRIHGGRAYVSDINTPVGRFNYHYESTDGQAGPPSPGLPLRLMWMQRPDGYKRQYAYEPKAQSGQPELMTGIAIVEPSGKQLRLHDWAYDSYGRAVLSRRIYPASSAYRLHIEYLRSPTEHRAGLTRITSAQGSQTTYQFAVNQGRYRLLEVKGAACPECSPTNTPSSEPPTKGPGKWQRPYVKRNDQGKVQRLYPAAPGWPGLYLSYNHHGLRDTWHSHLTGTETAQFDQLGRPIQRQFANGDEWRYDYDKQGRPHTFIVRNQGGTTTTRLSWRKALLTGVRHPAEDELRRHDHQGRLITRQLLRRVGHVSPVTYTEHFEYDASGRVLAHHLPEGGSLRYQYSDQGRILNIRWRNARGHSQEVIHATPDQPGYRYGNGLELVMHATQGKAAAFALHHQNEVLWEHFRAYDAKGRPQHEKDEFPTLALSHRWQLAYDAQSRLNAAATAPPGDALFYAWKDDGSAAAVRAQTQTERPDITRDPAGLPKTVGPYKLSYSAAHRLEAVSLEGNLIGRYAHNAFGHRVMAQAADETRHFFYLDNRLVAEARKPIAFSPAGRHLPITRRYIHAGHALVGIIDYTLGAPAGVLYAVHTDLLGAPRLITDARRKIRWLASYTPFGKAKRIVGDMELHMRLPGQIADPETGWHDNLLRTYDPHFGHYLESDPLGPLPATQALGYVAQQPRSYVDPLGLLLFAFDGTRQDARTRSNVWLLSQRYLDGPVFYHSGPGNPTYLDTDAMLAHQAPQIIETQWQHLLNALYGAVPGMQDPTPIDIIGYSRGAALARHFGNQIEQYVDQGLFSYADPLRGQISACVDLRFIGLFDTVAQFGLDGQLNSLYDFSIAAAWGWVAHAVALHERRWMFPLLAAGGDSADNIIEAPFIGAHGDIGGGLPAGERGPAHTHGDLSDVALNWMLWQAHIASVPWDNPAADQAVVHNPLLHDARSALARSVHEGDRRVDRPDGDTLHSRQDQHARWGKSQRDAVEALIQRFENWRSSDSETVGTIDMDAYAQWLRDELGWDQPPQATPAANQAII